jgi:lysozyme family protein
MNANFDMSFDRVMQSEGGYVWDKDDAGGETNLGVTIGAWGAYLGRPIKPGEMKVLTRSDVKPFYKKMYWDKVRGDDLPQGVDYAIFDFAVNAGPARAAKFLQQAAGAVADGAIGPGTMALVAKMPPTELLQKFARQKEAFYNSLAEKNPTQQKFLKGWLSRVAHVQTAASSMLA